MWNGSWLISHSYSRMYVCTSLDHFEVAEYIITLCSLEGTMGQGLQPDNAIFNPLPSPDIQHTLPIPGHPMTHIQRGSVPSQPITILWKPEKHLKGFWDMKQLFGVQYFHRKDVELTQQWSTHEPTKCKSMWQDNHALNHFYDTMFCYKITRVYNKYMYMYM